MEFEFDDNQLLLRQAVRETLAKTRLLRKDVQLIADLAATTPVDADHVASQERSDADPGDTLLAAADAALALMNVSR